MIETSLSHRTDEEANLEKLSCRKLAIVISGAECKPGLFLALGDSVDLKTCDLLKKQ